MNLKGEKICFLSTWYQILFIAHQQYWTSFNTRTWFTNNLIGLDTITSINNSE